MRLKDLFYEIHEFRVLRLLIQMNVPVFLPVSLALSTRIVTSLTGEAMNRHR